MNDINIPATQSSPAVTTCWADGVMEMRGDSYPENSVEFFEPILQWIQQYLGGSDKPLCLDLHLLYLNTSSVKAMMDVFDLLEAAHGRGRDITVCWYYESENARIAELAEEFREDCTFHFEVVCHDD